MKKKWLLAVFMTLLPFQAAMSGSQPAANQSQPTSSTVTPNSGASATQNAVAAGSGVRVHRAGYAVLKLDAIDSYGYGPKAPGHLPAGVAKIEGNMITFIADDGSHVTFPRSMLP